MPAYRISVPFKAGVLSDLNILQAVTRYASKAALIKELVEEALKMPGIKEKLLEHRVGQLARKYK